MKALVIHGPRDLRYETVSDPTIIDSRDIVVKMKQCGICGSDLHLFHGEGASYRKPVFGIGHEAIGEVVERGSAVTGLKTGDLVMLSGSVGCGACRSCLAGDVKRCETAPAEVYGIGRGLDGCQAEAIRVPAGDFNAAKIPEGVNDDQAILLTDNLPTAYAACLGADIAPGRSVAVIGLGPIGLIAVELAMVMGASVVYAVDPVADRRERATSIGAVALPPEDLVEVLREKTGGRMIDSVVEAVGSTTTVEIAMAIVGIGRTVSVLGVAFDLDFRIPFAACVNGVTVRANMLTEIARYWPDLVPMLQSGRISPERCVTDRMVLADGVQAYDRCAERAPGVLKMMMTPG